MAKQPYRLTEHEIKILEAGRYDPNIPLKYFYTSPHNPDGWELDRGFTENGKWQMDVLTAEQSDIVVIGGVGTGKTVGVGMGASAMCLLTHPDFRFLNVAPFTFQSFQMYRSLMQASNGANIEPLIWSSPQRPQPKIEYRFYIGDTLVTSTMEFMSVDKNADAIFTYEGDWIHIDEAGKIDNLDEVLVSLGTRLRGTIGGRERLARLSMTTNPWDNPVLWNIFDMAREDPESHFSLVLSTLHNKNITDQQIAKMLKRIHPKEHRRFINGSRPEGMGNYFDKDAIADCTSEALSRHIMGKKEAGVDGFDVVGVSGAGVVYYEMPPEDGRVYLILGDPGIGKPPHRNAPVLFVVDVTDFPSKPAILVSLWWGNGNGKINPFVRQLIKYAVTYQPIFAGVDSTATQKNMNEMINDYVVAAQLEDEEFARALGIEDAKARANLPKDFYVAGMDFSGARKAAYLLALQMVLEGRKMIWPAFAYGIKTQLGNYDLERDRKGSRLAQDIVSTLSMVAYAIRRLFQLDAEDLDRDGSQEAADQNWQSYLAIRRDSARSASVRSSARSSAR